MTLKANVHDLLKVHWYYPTLSEIWSYPLEDIAEEVPPQNGPSQLPKHPSSDS